jgi:peptidoglycan hydrolase CwlO-like protein
MYKIWHITEEGKRMKRRMASGVLMIGLIVSLCFATSFAQRESVLADGDEMSSILETLFVLKQQADAASRQASVLEAASVQLEAEIAAQSERIANMAEIAEEQRASVAAFLKYYQRTGPGSYFEMLLSADSLSSFLWQMNVIKDFSHNMTIEADALATTLQNLFDENTSLIAAKKAYEDEIQALHQQIDAAEARQSALNERLEALRAEGADYEAQLAVVDASWQVAQAEIAKLSEQLNALRDGDGLSSADYTLAFTFSGIEVTFSEASLNALINPSETPFVKIDCEPDLIRLTLDEGRLVIDGQFEIESETSIRFIPMTAAYMDMAIDAETLAAVFDSEPAIIDLSSALENGTIKQIAMKESALSITLSYFNF